ncbi:MAG: glycosyltransferase family 2 protein [Anaerolineae bacterium]
MTAISVVMPCHNRDYDLLRVLEAYDAQRGQVSFELIAIDDASTDDTHDVLKSYRPRHYSLRVERFEENQGPAAARNRGISLVQAPLLLFVGDDILPSADFVQGHVAAHREQPDLEVAILGQTVWGKKIPQNTLMQHIDGVGAEQFSYYYLQDGHEYDFRHLYTSNISLKRDFLCSLDRWFDTEFAYAAFEDVELAYRLAKHGLRIVYRSALMAEHSHYHTIWSFSTRQYRAGLMAWVLVRKHPLAAFRVFRLNHRRILKFFRYRGPILDTLIMSTLETQLLHLLSFYEWNYHALLDDLYVQALEYFYVKGVLDGIVGNSARNARVHTAHLRAALIPLLSGFIGQAHAEDIPLPLGLEQFLSRHTPFF